MTAEDRDHGDKAELIRIDEHTVKAILKNDELEPQDLKADLRHQERQSHDAQHRRAVHDEAADGIQLPAEVQMLFRMHRIEHEEAHRHMQQHDQIVRVI